MKAFSVVKQNGERELFDVGKLEASLRKLGTKEEVVREIADEVGRHAHDGISTREIYRRAYAILRRRHKPTAIRYSLKKAVALLGPTGFPFEKFVAEIFKAQGYETLVDQIVQGKCVEHETDVIAWKGDELIMVEAKFHTDFDLKSDLKVALYVKARYDDIFGIPYTYGGKMRKLSEGWIVTNTKFSEMAIRYGSCQPQLRLVCWNYPREGNLQDLIERYELIPLTALTALSSAERGLLISKGIVLSKALLDPAVFAELGFDDRKIRAVQAEVRELHEHVREQLHNRGK